MYEKWHTLELCVHSVQAHLEWWDVIGEALSAPERDCPVHVSMNQNTPTQDTH